MQSEAVASVQRGCKMTREDAKKVIVYAYQELPLPKFLEVIDEIYDDFEEELKKAYIEGDKGFGSSDKDNS